MMKAMKNKEKGPEGNASMPQAALKNKAIDKRADLTSKSMRLSKRDETDKGNDCLPADRTELYEQCQARLACSSSLRRK